MKVSLPTLRWIAALVFPCLAIHLFPSTREWLRYDRHAILNGESWRLFTCHLVHFSPAHLFLNLAAFALISLLPSKRSPGQRLLLISGMLFISTGLLLLRPGMAFYAGLSGVVTLLIWELAASGLITDPQHRTFFLCVIITLAAKLAFEFASGRSIALSFNHGVVTEPMAHLLGALFAIGWALLSFSYRHTALRPRLSCATK